MNERFELHVIGPEPKSQDCHHPHRQEIVSLGGVVYRLLLRNNGNTFCDAIVWVEGKRIGKWEIGPNSQIVIDGPHCITQKIVQLKKNWNMITGKTDKLKDGFVEVEFIPDKIIYTGGDCVLSIESFCEHGGSVHLNQRGVYYFVSCNCEFGQKTRDLLEKLDLPRIENIDHCAVMKLKMVLPQD